MREIIQFGDKWITYEGESATQEEIDAAYKRIEEAKERSREYIVLAEKKKMEFHKEYDKAMTEFFGDNDYEYFDDEESLVYRLSTAIFDCEPNPIKLAEIRRKFPKLYELAWQGFIDGNHDT